MTFFSAADKNAYVEKLCDYDLLILDDIGTERNTDYSLEMSIGLLMRELQLRSQL